MSFVVCTAGHQIHRRSIISRGGIIGILVAGGLIVGTFLPGHLPHIDPPETPAPAIVITPTTSPTTLSLGDLVPKRGLQGGIEK